MIEGVNKVYVLNNNCGLCVPTGEPVLFWNDLTYANGSHVNMVEGNFNPCVLAQYVCIIGPGGDPASPYSSGINLWFPEAKLGEGNLFYVYSLGGSNYFGLSVATQIYYSTLTSRPELTVAQAYNIDKKMDDGLPQTGNVVANYVNGIAAITNAGASDTSATPGSSTTCYDNGNVAGAVQSYSLEISNGANVNCALSFRFQ